MAIEFNALETERFGVRCAHVVSDQAKPSEIKQLARQQGIRFLSVRISTDDISRVQDFEENGFRLMDVLVVYSANLTNEPSEPSKLATIVVRKAEVSDAEAVAAVALKAFAGYPSHFHSDQRLSICDADAVYADWAANSVRSAKSNSQVLVGETRDQIVGFLATRRVGAVTGEITLNAVDPLWQEKGIYGCLLDHGLRRFHSEGCTEAVVSTQVNNIAVQKAWGQRGFLMQKSYYTLHKWLDD